MRSRQKYKIIYLPTGEPLHVSLSDCDISMDSTTSIEYYELAMDVAGDCPILYTEYDKARDMGYNLKPAIFYSKRAAKRILINQPLPLFFPPPAENYTEVLSYQDLEIFLKLSKFNAKTFKFSYDPTKVLSYIKSSDLASTLDDVSEASLGLHWSAVEMRLKWLVDKIIRYSFHKSFTHNKSLFEIVKTDQDYEVLLTENSILELTR